MRTRYGSSAFDARFAPYAAQFEAFAHSRNLLIEKYYHEAPTWSFCFAHSRGGQAKLDLSIDDVGTVVLQTVWWIDSYREFTRSLRWGERIEVPGDGERFVTMLEQALRTVVSWQPGEWTRVATDYESIWGRYTEAQFRAMTPAWPLPRI